MGKRRNSLIILGLVVVLLATSIYVIAKKPTVLGLDLKGGTELVYQGRPTPQVPDVTPEDIDRAIEIIRQRVDSLGVSEPEISRVGGDQIEIGLPNVSNADRAAESVGTTAQLYLYDFEPNVIPPNKSVQDPAERPYNRLYDAVLAASKQAPVSDEQCAKQGCTASGDTYYLFDANTLEPIGDPSEKKVDLFASSPNEKQPPNTKLLAVPQGTVVLEDKPEDDPTTDVDESATGSQFFVLHDKPSLTGDQITDPKPGTDQFNQPTVDFNFTDSGQEAFASVTQEIAQRGAADCFAATSTPCGGIASNQADQFSGSFAIVLDGELISRPIINFIDNPNGIDGRTGAQISGVTAQEANDLAEVLKIGALPIKLALISQSTVSATLGQQALDQGLKAGLIGLGLVVLFLLFYYRFLGLIAALGLLVYALFYFALIKALPITVTLPGIAGLILTIGVAADSNIVIFERIKDDAVVRVRSRRGDPRVSAGVGPRSQVRDVLLGRRVCARPQHQCADHRGCGQGRLGGDRQGPRPASGATDKERALIEALAKRYTADPKSERPPLDKAYTDAMREVTNGSRTISTPPPCSRSR